MAGAAGGSRPDSDEEEVSARASTYRHRKTVRLAAGLVLSLGLPNSDTKDSGCMTRRSPSCMDQESVNARHIKMYSGEEDIEGFAEPWHQAVRLIT